MRKIHVDFLIFLLLFLMKVITFAQGGRALPEDNLAYPILIQFSNSFGSGFFINTKDAVYLITAKHVLWDSRTNNVLEREVKVKCQPRDKTEGAIIELKIDLSSLMSKALLKTHPDYDIAVVRVGKIVSANNLTQLELEPQVTIASPTKSGIVGAGIELCKKRADVLIGNDVFLFGYPNTIGLPGQPQIDYDKPLLRKGIISGANNTRRVLIIDCPAFPGNSGGPVVQVEHDFTVTRFSIIGIVTEFVPYNRNPAFNSGYSVVTPMDPILEIVETYGKTSRFDPLPKTMKSVPTNVNAPKSMKRISPPRKNAGH